METFKQENGSLNLKKNACEGWRRTCDPLFFIL